MSESPKVDAPGSSQKIHGSTKLAAVVDTLGGQGISALRALSGVGVQPDELHSPETLVSLKQLIIACRNAIELSRDPSLPYAIGSAIHVSTYGMYGYAILCSTNFRRAMGFAANYHPLAAPLAAISFSEQEGMAAWEIEPIIDRGADPRLYRFIAEMQIGIHASLHRDIMGASFAPREITVTYPPADDFRLTAALIGCPVRFEQPANRLVFQSRWLDEVPKFGNRTTYSAVVDLCDALLADMTRRTGVAGRIRKILLQDIANGPTLDAIAALLGTTTRTIRRQLSQQGTSFRELMDEVRSQVAIKYLRQTELTNEDIASALGFADAANFRHAFRRWTGKTPSEFRGS
ncbi:AraC family transcriptional regulator [Bradyrhizobium sp. Arg314]